MVLCQAALGSAQDAARTALPLVWVLATGGTISGRGASSTSLTEYKSGAVRGEELVKGVPEIQRVARIQVEQITNVSSTDITIANWLTIARRINQIFAADPTVAGVVVTHGTNTLEETAYFLNLTVKDVFAGTGDGLLSTGEREALTPIVAMPAASRPVLVRSNRTGNGRVASRDDYDALGMIPADTLNPQKARILLMLALTKPHDLDEIRRMFAEY